jgi:hypothetical protein
MTISLPGDADIDAEHGRRLQHVERLAGRDAFQNIDDDHVGKFQLRQPSRTARPNVAGAYNGDFLSHDVLPDGSC